MLLDQNESLSVWLGIICQALPWQNQRLWLVSHPPALVWREMLILLIDSV